MGFLLVDIHMKNKKRPFFTIYIGRAVQNTEFTTDSKWANPFKKSESQALTKYNQYIQKKIIEKPEIYNILELKNETLGCWCLTTNYYSRFPEINQCHGQILLQILFESIHKKLTK